MPYTVDAARWTDKPLTATGIDASHPLADSVIRLFAMTGVVRDMLGASVTFGAVMPAQHGTVVGAGYKTAGATNSYWSAVGHQLTKFTHEVLYVPSTATSQAILGMAEFPGSGTYDRTIGILSTGNFAFRIYDGAGKQAISTTSAAVGTPVHIVATADGATIKIYINGELEAITAAGNAYTGYASPELVAGYGDKGDGLSGTETGNGTIVFAAVYSRALTSDEIARRYNRREQSVWTLLEPDTRRVYFTTGGATTKTITDTATATDAIGNIAVGLLLSDTAAGNDALPGAAAEFGLADTGAGNDAIAQLLASLSQSDAGSGADAVSNIAAALTLADSGAGTDAVPSIEALLQITDSGSGADLVTVLSELLKTILDTGEGSDALAISAAIALSDTGAATDAVSIAVTLTLTDTGAGADAVSILTDILKSIADAGAGSDAIAGISVQASVSDSAAGNDAQSIAVTLAVIDTLSGVDDVLASVLIALADSGLGGDVLAITVQANVMDSGTGVDAMPAITAALQIIDAAGGTDVVMAFDAQTRIAKIRFSLRGRTLTMTLKGRKAKFTLH